jgi:hypothetical protein
MMLNKKQISETNRTLTIAIPTQLNVIVWQRQDGLEFPKVRLMDASRSDLHGA